MLGYITSENQTIIQFLLGEIATLSDAYATGSSNPSVWKVIYEIVDFLGIIVGILVGIIAIATFFRTYLSKHMKILGWYYSSHICEGYIFGINVQNKCLTTLCFKQVIVLESLSKYLKSLILLSTFSM